MSSSIKAALAANSGVAVAKTIGAFITGSASMAAEAIHSFADCGNQLLLMWGMKSSGREADKNHPFGYGMNVYFWSFIVALVLFTIGGAYSVYEGVHKVMHPEPLQHVQWAAAILALGFVLELRSFKTCLAEIREEYPGKSMRWFFKETRRPELLVIFGEDLAALMGLGIAAAFLLLAFFTGNPVWDAVGSIMVGVLLMFVAVALFMETKALMLGQSVDPVVRQELRQTLMDVDEIEHVYECRTLQFGDEALLAIRARFVNMEEMTGKELVDLINRVEAKLYAQFPIFTRIFFEPDDQFEDC